MKLQRVKEYEYPVKHRDDMQLWRFHGSVCWCFNCSVDILIEPRGINKFPRHVIRPLKSTGQKLSNGSPGFKWSSRSRMDLLSTATSRETIPIPLAAERSVFGLDLANDWLYVLYHKAYLEIDRLFEDCLSPLLASQRLRMSCFPGRISLFDW
jgi:hypothetical protein